MFKNTSVGDSIFIIENKGAVPTFHSGTLKTKSSEYQSQVPGNLYQSQTVVDLVISLPYGKDISIDRIDVLLGNITANNYFISTSIEEAMKKVREVYNTYKLHIESIETYTFVMESCSKILQDNGYHVENESTRLSKLENSVNDIANSIKELKSLLTPNHNES